MPVSAFNPNVFQFIQDHIDDDPVQLMMKAKQYQDLPIREIAGQIASRQKARTKLPEWFQHPEVIFPPKENLEQASSEITAKFKAGYVSGDSILDLTGGTGIDLFYMSNGFSSVAAAEPVKELCELLEYNFRLFGKKVTVIQDKAEKVLTDSRSVYDVIYLDPSRRDSKKRRVFGLEQYQPKVTELYTQLMEKGKEIVIKTSPMIDIKQTLRMLPNTYRVQVVGVGNEVKEVLFYLKKGFDGEPLIQAWNLSDLNEEECFEFDFSWERAAIPEISETGKYLYEPNSSIRKAGGFNLIGTRFNLNKLHIHTHLYSSDILLTNFPGRIFEILDIIKPKKKEIKKRYPQGKVNVIARNYPLKPNDLKKKFRLKDGGDEFLFFCETQNTGKSVLVCRPAELN